MLTHVAGVDIWYDHRVALTPAVGGASDPVVILHGWGASSATMEQMAACVSTRHDVYMLDFPGFGHSAPPPIAWSTVEYAEIVVAWMDAIGIERVRLIGHSFGGRVSIRVASRWPARVDRIVLVGSAGIPPARTPRQHVTRGLSKVGKAVFSLPGLASQRDTARDILALRYGSVDYQQAGPLRDTFVRVVNEDLTPLLSAILAPTLLIWGQNDNETPLSDGKIMERLIPDAGLVVFEQAGHYAFLDQPARFCTVVRQFLENPT